MFDKKINDELLEIDFGVIQFTYDSLKRDYDLLKKEHDSLKRDYENMVKYKRMTLKDFFSSFKHSKEQVEHYATFFNIYKNGKQVYSGHPSNIGYDEEGNFSKANEYIKDIINDEIDSFYIDEICTDDVTFVINLK